MRFGLADWTVTPRLRDEEDRLNGALLAAPNSGPV